SRNPVARCMQPGERGEKACQARGSQRRVALAAYPAQPLDRTGGVVADAVDREEYVIGAGDEAGQQAAALLDAAVVMEKLRAGALDQALQLRNLMGAAPDVEEGGAGEVEPVLLAVRLRSRDPRQMVVDERQLAARRLALALACFERALFLAQRRGELAQPPFARLPPRCFARKPALQIGNDGIELRNLFAARGGCGALAGLARDHLVEPADRLVADVEPVAQLALLPLDFCGE